MSDAWPDDGWMTSSVVLGALVAGPVAATLAPYLWIERRFRPLWAGVPLPSVTVRAAPYRAARVVPGHTTRAPGIVRVAALSCFFLGQMFVPGLLVALVGLFVMGIGLVAIPGLIVAAKLWLAGVHLLKGTPESVGAARSAARWSIQLNSLLTVVCLTGGAFAAVAWARSPYYDRSDLEALLWLLGFTQAYAFVSLGQAALVARATRDLASEEELRAQDVLPRWLRIALDRKDARRA